MPRKQPHPNGARWVYWESRACRSMRSRMELCNEMQEMGRCYRGGCWMGHPRRVFSRAELYTLRLLVYDYFSCIFFYRNLGASCWFLFGDSTMNIKVFMSKRAQNACKVASSARRLLRDLLAEGSAEQLFGFSNFQTPNFLFSFG